MKNKRLELVNEINRMRKAMENTKSSRLRRDYGKAIKRMVKELAMYDAFKTKEVEHE